MPPRSTNAPKSVSAHTTPSMLAPIFKESISAAVAAQRKSPLGGRKTYHVHMQCFSHVFFGVPHRARIEEGHWEKSCSVAHVHDEAAFYLAKNTGVQALSAMHGLLQNVHIVGSDTQGLGCSCWGVGPWHGMEYLG